jgi:hypothetical protein
VRFLDDLKGYWRDSDKAMKVIIVVTFPVLVVAYWLAKAFDTDDID